MPAKSLLLYSPAKINLFLRVGAKRLDGYHDLQTVFQEISLSDTLRCSVAVRDIVLRCASSHVPCDDTNLIVKALLLLRDHMGLRRGMQVHLTKRIPVGAGLGGGSSNAAAALWAGYALWTGKSINKNNVPQALRDCAVRLGADVPFFLRGGRAWAEGIGEQLTPLPSLQRKWLVLVYPRVHVATPLAYRHLGHSQPPLVSALNSFEPVIFEKYPAVKKAHQALREAGCADVLMSGSGSSVFGFVADKKEGTAVSHRLCRYPWDVFVAHTV